MGHWTVRVRKVWADSSCLPDRRQSNLLVKFFLCIFQIFVLRNKEISVLGDSEKSSTIFLILSHLGRQSNNMDGSAYEWCHYTLVRLHQMVTDIKSVISDPIRSEVKYLWNISLVKYLVSFWLSLPVAIFFCTTLYFDTSDLTDGRSSITSG